MYFCPFNSMLADKLNMSPEEAERWIVNLIRNARLDAKIDSKLVMAMYLISQFNLFFNQPFAKWKWCYHSIGLLGCFFVT